MVEVFRGMIAPAAEVFRGMIAPAAKAVAALLLPFVLMALSWVAENSGADLGVNPDQIQTWIVTGFVAVANALLVYFTRNGVTADPTTSTPQV